MINQNNRYIVIKQSNNRPIKPLCWKKQDNRIAEQYNNRPLLSKQWNNGTIEQYIFNVFYTIEEQK